MPISSVALLRKSFLFTQGDNQQKESHTYSSVMGPIFSSSPEKKFIKKWACKSYLNIGKSTAEYDPNFIQKTYTTCVNWMAFYINMNYGN